jgi:hypothetical protein
LYDGTVSDRVLAAPIFVQYRRRCPGVPFQPDLVYRIRIIVGKFACRSQNAQQRLAALPFHPEFYPFGGMTSINVAISSAGLLEHPTPPPLALQHLISQTIPAPFRGSACPNRPPRQDGR